MDHRGQFDGQKWWNDLMNNRTRAALAHLPPMERKLQYKQERERQEKLYRQERDAKKRAKRQKNKERQLNKLGGLTEKGPSEPVAAPQESVPEQK